MNEVLSTVKLKALIEDAFVKKLSGILDQEINLPEVYFAKGTDNSAEGTYVFGDEKGYNYLYTEKGKIRKHEITNDILQIVYWTLDDVIFNFALEYATKFRKTGQDFRRKLFQKEQEIWKMLDEDGYNKKCLEIKKTLEENPYTDDLN